MLQYFVYDVGSGVATYRNASYRDLIVALGLPSGLSVAPDESFTVDDEFVENYDLNDNLVRVDSPTIPPGTAVDAPSVEAPVAE